MKTAELFLCISFTFHIDKYEIHLCHSWHSFCLSHPRADQTFSFSEHKIHILLYEMHFTVKIPRKLNLRKIESCNGENERKKGKAHVDRNDEYAISPILLVEYLLAFRIFFIFIFYPLVLLSFSIYLSLILDTILCFFRFVSRFNGQKTWTVIRYQKLYLLFEKERKYGFFSFSFFKSSRFTYHFL